MDESGAVAKSEVPGMARRVEARRRALGLTPGDFVKATGLSSQGAKNVRNGLRRDYLDDTIFGVARALRWTTDWYQRLLDDEDPEIDDGVFPSVGRWEERGTPDLAASGAVDVSDLSEADRQYVLDLVERLRGR
jgi:hypothetical protein